MKEVIWFVILPLISLLIAYEWLGEYGDEADAAKRYRSWIVLAISFLLIAFVYLVAVQIGTVLKRI